MDEEQKREDLASIEPGFNKILESNDKISDEFKDLAKACFGRIFYMLGEKDFKRWINTRKLSNQIKELVIESMDKQELENNPTTGGYFTLGTTNIKVNKNFKDLRPINIHETFHLITDNENRFGTFIDEGLTEYMKTLAWGRTTAYSNNVDSVKFFHEVFGDSIIKAYLLGKDGFDEQMLNLINYDGKSTIQDVKRFYSNLDMFHNYKWEKNENEQFKRNGATPEIIDRSNKRYEKAKQNYETVKPEIISMHQKIIVGRISEMSKNLEFYKDGQIDLEFASKTIDGLIEKCNITNFIIENGFIEEAEWKTETAKLAAEQVLENSHLLVPYQGDERDSRKSELVSKMIPQINATKGTMSKTPAKIKNTDPLVVSENSNVASNLFKNTLTEGLSIGQYIENVARIATVTGISPDELEDYIAKYNIKCFGNINDFKNVNETIIACIPKIQKISEIKNQRKKDTISSEYKSIGDGRFIEKRDNQVFFVELDDNGELVEQELKHSKGIIFLKNGSRLDIDMSKGLPNLEVIMNNKKLGLSDTMTLQDIEEMELANEFSKKFRSDIESRKYTTILDDAKNPYKVKGIRYTLDVDQRSRQVDFNSYIKDLKNTLQLIPEAQKDRIIRELAEQLLEKSYGLKNFNMQDETRENVQAEYETIINAVSDLVKQENSKVDISVLENSSRNLNGIRHTLAGENSKNAAISFENDEAKKQYYAMLEKEKQDVRDSKIIEKVKAKQKRELEAKQDVKEATQKFKYNEFYQMEGDIPLEELPYHLSGVRTTQVIDTRNVSFNYNEFANSARELISSYPADVQNEIFDKIFSTQMSRTYLTSSADSKSPDVEQAIENVKNMIKGNIFSNTPIEADEISPNLEALNEFRVEKAKYLKTVAGVQFANEHAENMFHSFSEIIEIVKKSGIRGDQLESEVKSIMKLQLQREDPDKEENSHNNLEQ